ncbi:hypothetical protein [Novosphingobium sp. AAP83]|uniref:hypothetical protein n=1 Tax=Novosphingobium sp. AAP83 TaxID=1523425 RepID=UPI0018D133CD|nr:hypothetical protein [Novosphingobium sp. AAP83]
MAADAVKASAKRRSKAVRLRPVAGLAVFGIALAVAEIGVLAWALSGALTLFQNAPKLSLPESATLAADLFSDSQSFGLKELLSIRINL